MNDRAILDLAEQHLNMYGRWTFTAEDLIAFARAILEAEQKPTTIRVPMPVFVKLVKDVNSVKDLLIAMKAAEEE